MKLRTMFLSLLSIGLLIVLLTFFKVQNAALLCNVFRAEANWVATVATFFAAIGFMLGVVFLWVIYKRNGLKKGRLFVFAALMLMCVTLGHVACLGVRRSIEACTKMYVETNRFATVTTMAAIFAAASTALGAASIVLGAAIRRNRT